MTKNDLPAMRQLAANGQIVYTDHGVERMIERGYTTSDVEKILTSPTTQFIETQSPNAKHPHERGVVSDPLFMPDTAIVFAINLSNPSSPELVIITVEEATNEKWEKSRADNPWLVRK